MESHSDNLFSIPQAANILKVTHKTVRNYLDRGLIQGQKWNGSWRIAFDNLNEIYCKKYGRKLEFYSPEIFQSETKIQILREDYDELQKRSGKLEAAESDLRSLQTELKAANERLVQLEASSASAWTEARKYKEDLDERKETLELAKKQAEVAQQESQWLRREWERLRTINREREQEERELGERLREKDEALAVFREVFREIQQ